MNNKNIFWIRIIAIVVGIIGGLYSILGISLFIGAIILKSKLPIPGSNWFSKFIISLVITGIIYIPIGLIALKSAIALFKINYFYRLYSIWVIILISIFSILNDIHNYIRNHQINFPLFTIFMIFFTVISWIILTKPQVKELFKQHLKPSSEERI